MDGTELKRLEDNFATLALHSGYVPRNWSNMPVVAPLVTSVSYKHVKPGHYSEFNYSRLDNPCRRDLERSLAALEGAKYAVTFPTGMAAVTSIASMFSPGDHFVISNDIYGGTMKYFLEVAPRQGFQVDFVDMVSNHSELKRMIRPNTKMMWFETPTNPTMSLVDIKKVSEIAKKISMNIVIVVDNTFLTPYFQRPLELGASISMYSISKYMNGHSDVVMGAAVTNCAKLYKELVDMQKVRGICPSPFDCHQVSRALKTLPLRMDEHHKNSLKIAKYLETNPYVLKVNHPGLESHPSHELAVRQSTGHSGIMSFCIRGGLKEVERFICGLKLIPVAPSLGGAESLVGSPALMSHVMISKAKREAMGITDSLVRLSVGIENANDLIGDIEQALQKAYH